MSVYGIKETKEVVKAGLAIQVALKKALADGSIGLTDIVHLPSVLGPVKAAVADVHLLPKEIADLQEGEFDELVALAKDAIADLTPDEYEFVVWTAIAIIKSLLLKG